MSKLGATLNRHKNLILITLVVVGIGIGPALELLAYHRCAPDNSWDLYKAIRGGDAARVSKLLAHGAKPNSSKCCFYDESEGGIKQLNERETPLAVAVEGHDREVVRLLLEAGADPNLPSEFGRTPLIIAIQQRHQKMVPMLLAHGADPNHPDEQNATPFMLADESNEDDSKKALLAAGADPRRRERTPIKPKSDSPNYGDE
jgi:ankyrin repeat protein